MNNLWVTDIDDFVLQTMPIYNVTIIKCIEIITKSLWHKAPYLYECIELFKEIQKKSAQGPHKERLHRNVLTLYRDICSKYALTPRKDIEKNLYELCEWAFSAENYSRLIDPNAKELFQFLKANGDTIIPLTRGDPTIQNVKIKIIDETIGPIFTLPSFYTPAVPMKTEGVFERIKLGFREYDRYFAMGNSFQYDLSAAVVCGFYGIRIKPNFWAPDADENEITRHSNARTLNGLLEIKKLYNELVAACPLSIGVKNK
ncbi:MAG: hypothetical protein HYW78_01910 [Parcubacteria group bacterium]|nr:hypothetical protein [Parcubacteria group bacterium]